MPYYNRDPKRDPNFDNHPFDTGSLDVKGSGDVFVGGSVNGMGPRGLGFGLQDLGVSETRGPKYRTLNSRILIIMDPKIRYP